ncbi:MAG: hypothetical protein IKY52_05540 [Clostridia bacterium]|nr:hypothetical protein [Clostridia bacterium]
MRLFHVSEEPDIAVFHPRLPARADLDPNVGLVWAIDEARLPNFLTPRDCPRVTFHLGENTTDADRERFLPAGFHHAVILEEDWRERKVLVCFTENLWPIAESVQKSTLHWSLYRMKNAKAKPCTRYDRETIEAQYVFSQMAEQDIQRSQRVFEKEFAFADALSRILDNLELCSNGTATEQYIGTDGRTVLWRRFNRDDCIQSKK